MSSRGQFIGSGADAGIYQPRPVPAESDQLATYINDELLQLGGRFNEVLEGGAFPPSSVLPKRWKDGQMVYFTKKLEDTYPNGPHKGRKVIPTPGVYVYKDGREIGDPEPADGSVEGKWWKMIDDPSEIDSQRFVFQLGDENKPDKPEDGYAYPPNLWSISPPEKTNKVQFIWASEQLSVVDGYYEWGEPIMWSAGVYDGSEGISTEQRFIAWPEGTPPVIANELARYPETTTGELFTLTIPPTDPPNSVYVYVTNGRIGSETDEVKGAWSDPVKYSTPDTTRINRLWAIGEKWGDFYPSFDPSGNPTPGPGWTDQVPPYDNSRPQWVTDRLEWLNGAPQTIWTTPTAWNSPQGEKGDVGLPGGTGTAWITINSGSWDDGLATQTIINTFGRDPINWDVVTMVDHTTEFTQAKRWDGINWIEDNQIVDGSMVVDGTIIGKAIKASTQIRIGGADAGGDPNYVVVIDGNPSEPYLFFAGHPEGRFANFTIDKNGNMEAKNALFHGNITTGSTVTGGTINGSQINSANGNFTVDTEGNMTCQDATINGTLYGDIGANAARLIGSEIHVPNLLPKPAPGQPFTGFHVYSDGSTYIGTDATIAGSVEATNIIGDIVSAIIKDNAPVTMGYKPGSTWIDLKDVVTIQHNRSYPRHLKIGLTERAQGFCVSCSTQGFGDQYVQVRLYNRDTDNEVWKQGFSLPDQRTFTINILSISAVIDELVGAGTYVLQIMSNRTFENGIKYMYDNYTNDSSGAVTNTKIEAYLFKNSGELS
ncbi:hypothetical protein [Vibrio phage vB_VpaP_SJSY21]|nr:hypothetical protein [Vibrio phage vB_VpaP_SJSY21]